jgi:hypothetical protein
MPGDHICALYYGPAERDEVLLPHLREGLRHKNWCFAAVNDPDASRLLSGLQHAMGTSRVIGSQLDLRTEANPVTSEQRFSIAEVLKFWDTTVDRALSAGKWRFARLTAEASWWTPQLPDLNALINYECELNRFANRHPQSVLCLYDLTDQDGSLVVDLVQTHPKILLCGLLVDNPYYLPPDEFQATHKGIARRR